MPADEAVRTLLMCVGRRVAELRRAQHLTQESFAERLGVSVRYVQNVEQGRENLTLASMLRLAAALCATPADLLTSPVDPEAGSNPP